MAAIHRVVLVAGLAALAVAGADRSYAQGRGGASWSTSQGDAQRTGWVRTDPKISVQTLSAPGFQFLWKRTLDNPARLLSSLTQPVTLQNIISYKGFKALAFVGGSSDRVFSIDYDLNRLFWSRQLPTETAVAGSMVACPGGLTTIARQTNVAPAAAGGRGFGFAAAPPPAAGRGAPPAAAPGAPAPPARGGGGGGGGRGGGNNNTIAIAGNGAVYALNPQTGDDAAPPVPLLPAGATAAGAILIDNTLYTATTGNCGGSSDAVYAVDVTPNSGNARSIWSAGGAPIAGTAGPAFGSDGTVYVATGSGTGTANAIVALDGKSLALKSAFRTSTAFTSSPVVFPYKGRDYIAAANRDGRLYLLDSAALDQTPVMSVPYSSGAFATGALATWEEAAGTRWLLVPSDTPMAGAGFTAAGGAATNGRVLAFKIVESDGRPSLQPAWASRDLTSPVAPLVMNGVVFVLSTGEFRGAGTAAERRTRSSPAVLYAIDGATGTELWNSATTITSFVHEVPPSGSDSQIYVATADGTLYTFGMPTER